MKKTICMNALLIGVFLFLHAVQLHADSRTVTLKEAGTLSSYIPVSDYKNVTVLKLNGPINGTDINVLNKLSGLEELDLSGTQLVNGGAYYYNYTSTQKLLGSTIYYRTYYYTASKNSDEQSSKPPYEHKYSHYRNNLENAFYNNKSLKRVYFPTAANTETIGKAAFTGTNLETIYIGGNIKELSAESFRRCPSLKEVNVTSSLYFTKGDDGNIYGSTTGKKALAFVPPAQKVLVIPDFVDSISWTAFPGTLDEIYIETKSIKNAAMAFSKNSVSTKTPVYAYHDMVEALKKYFDNIQEYGVSISLSENVFNKLAFTIDTVVGPSTKSTFALKSVVCNGKPCTLGSDGRYTAVNAGLDVRNVSVTYVMGGSEYTVKAEYPAVSPTVTIDTKSNVAGQTYVGTRAMASADDYLKPSETGIIFNKTTKMAQGSGASDIVKFTGLSPESACEVVPYAVYDGVTYKGAASYLRTKNLDVKVTSGSSTVTTFSCSGTWTKGDAEITKYGFEWDGKKTWNNSREFRVEGLNPNTSYSVRFCVEYGGHTYHSAYYSFKTKAISIETLPAEAVSNPMARICAKTNCDATTGAGFEWRRYDAPDLVPSSYAECPIIDGKLSGTLKNLSANTYYKYRPYYKDGKGTYYFGEWSAFGTADAYVYFEPDVYTSTYTIENDIVKLKGYIVLGSDKIVRQGFEYWAVKKNAVRSRAAGNDVQVVLADGETMEAALSGLVPGEVYEYRAFATTEAGTTYGTVSQFTAPIPVGIEALEGAGEELAVVFRNSLTEFAVTGTKKRCNYRLASLTGQTLQQGIIEPGSEWKSISKAASGIYILTVTDGSRKVARKIRLN